MKDQCFVNIDLYIHTLLLEMLSIIYSLNALHSTLSPLHHRLPKSLSADAISSLPLFEIDMGRKSVFRTLRNNVTVMDSRTRNDF